MKTTRFFYYKVAETIGLPVERVKELSEEELEGWKAYFRMKEGKSKRGY